MTAVQPSHAIHNEVAPPHLARWRDQKPHDEGAVKDTGARGIQLGGKTLQHPGHRLHDRPARQRAGDDRAAIAQMTVKDESPRHRVHHRALHLFDRVRFRSSNTTRRLNRGDTAV